MQIIPAIDIKKGLCVRLYQGDPHKETVYDEDPSNVALRWTGMGAQRLHVIDLDAAFSGNPINVSRIKKIIETSGVPVQVGGGLRSIETIEMYMENGADRVILGTQAAKDPQFIAEASSRWPGKVWVSIDAKEGRVVLKGWTEQSGVDALRAGTLAETMGASGIIFTDTYKDGTLEGPNLGGIRRIATSVNIPIIASGGIGSLEDIKSVASLKIKRIEGIIVGKALYAGKVDLKEAIDLLAGK